MNKTEYYTHIFNRYGNIKRGRGCFLYTAKGERLTDLYQEEGRAILGWGGGAAFTVLKNVLNRGLTGSFKTDFSYRLKKAVDSLLFGDFNVAVFNSMDDAMACAPGKAIVWRPWNYENADCVDFSSVVFNAPLPWPNGLVILASKLEISCAQKSVVLPAVMEASVTKSIYQLICAIQNRQEKDFFIYDSVLTKYFTRKGPWLFPKIPESEYDKFVLHCLNLGIVISPEFNVPGLVPFGANAGVFDCLKKNPFSAEN